MPRSQALFRTAVSALGMLTALALQAPMSGCSAPYDSHTDDCALGGDYREVRPRKGDPYYLVNYSFTVDMERYTGKGRLSAEPVDQGCRAFYMARDQKNNSLESTTTWHPGRTLNEKVSPWLQVLLVLSLLPLGVFAYTFLLPKVWAESTSLPVDAQGSAAVPNKERTPGDPVPQEDRGRKALIAFVAILAAGIGLDLASLAWHRIKHPDAAKRIAGSLPAPQKKPDPEEAPIIGSGSAKPGPALDSTAMIAVTPQDDLRRIGAESKARETLLEVRQKLSAFIGQNKGRPPRDIMSFFRHMGSLPSVSLPPYHPQTTGIANLKSLDDPKTADTGGWGYVYNPKSPDFGAFFINCTHTDMKGTAWDSY
ncbi:MAG: hypothetical protein WC943_10780 [Elusimicrobiota bacterium]